MRRTLVAGLLALFVALLVMGGLWAGVLRPRAYVPHVEVPTVDTALQATYYVAPTGDDENDGRSPERAFATLTRALEVARGGDTVLLLPGVYHEFAEVYNLGQGVEPLVIRGTRADEVVFDGKNRLGSAFQCWECANVHISDLTVRNYRWEGLGIFLSRDVRIERVRVRRSGTAFHPDVEDGGSGITLVESRNIILEDALVEDVGLRQVEEEMSGNGVNMWRCQDCLVRNVQVRRVQGTGILVEESCRVRVEASRVEAGEMDMGDWWDAGIWLDGGHDVVVEGNVFVNNHGPGIQVSDTETVYPQGSRGFVVRENRSQGNVFGIYMWNYGMCPPPEDALRLEGNIFQGNTRDVQCVPWQCGVGQPCVSPGQDTGC